MKKSLAIFCLLISGVLNLSAQVFRVDSLLSVGDSLREIYRFEESLEAYAQARDCLNDTLIIQSDSTYNSSDSLYNIKVSDRILLSENGQSMTRFVYAPNVVAKHKFSLEDFFLYYPLQDMSWRKTPNLLDSLSGDYAKAIYAPAEDKTIYYSAPDPDGIRNIYRTSLTDSLWTLPELLNEQMTSVSDEIYPMISKDGKHLYFASQGLYGVGGYDLYVSEWDEAANDWSVPVNMGFPYSSPANDFLLVNTDDGSYTIFASDRECGKDSVWVYVLEYDSMPVRKEISDPDQLMGLSRLDVSAGLEDVSSPINVKSDIPENVDTRRYMDKMSHVRALRDTIAATEASMSADRERYMQTDNEKEKETLAARILRGESMIPEYQARLDEAVRQLQDIEMDFLFSGVVIDPDNLLAEAEREIISENPGYVFTKMSWGETLTLDMELPKKQFDYSFKILPEAQFAEDSTIPDGVVYQIQLFLVTSPASLKSLKGLSPVFETRSSSGRYIYRVGLFNSYSDVLSCLNRVKKLGFRSAYIVGYVDGKEMSVKKVRDVEAERKKAAVKLFSVKIIPAGGELDGVAMNGIRQQASGKDIARIDGGLVVGPFDNKSSALALVEFIEVMGYGDAALEEIQSN